MHGAQFFWHYELKYNVSQLKNDETYKLIMMIMVFCVWQ